MSIPNNVTLQSDYSNQLRIDLLKEELGIFKEEWKECRTSIARFNTILIDLRKYGFTIISSVVAAFSIIFGTLKKDSAIQIDSAIPMIVVPSVILILLFSLFLADRYYEILLMGAIARCQHLENVSHELFDEKLNSNIYLRLDLTTSLEAYIQKFSARYYSTLLYFGFVISVTLLGILALILYLGNKNIDIWFSASFYTLLVVFLLFITGFVFVERRHSSLMLEIRNERHLANNVVVRIIFRKEQVTKAIEELAQGIKKLYSKNNFKIVTIGEGGLDLSTKLTGKLKDLGIRNFVLVPASIEKDGSFYFSEEHQENLKGRNILIVDDLLASGNTITKLKEICQKLNPDSQIKTCVLLDAPSRRDYKYFDLDLLGLESKENKDVNYVGAGMDFDSKHRELKYIGVIKETRFVKNIFQNNSKTLD